MTVAYGIMAKGIFPEIIIFPVHFSGNFQFQVDK